MSENVVGETWWAKPLVRRCPRSRNPKLSAPSSRNCLLTCPEVVVAAEVKLSGTVDDGDVKHLRWLRETIGDDLLDAVVITTGSHAYRRPDGIAVVPAAPARSGARRVLPPEDGLRLKATLLCAMILFKPTKLAGMPAQ